MEQVYKAASYEEALKAAKKAAKRLKLWFDVDPFGYHVIDLREQGKELWDCPTISIYYPEP